jgi:hypothetical protein
LALPEFAMPGDSTLELGVSLGHYHSNDACSNDPGQLAAVAAHIEDEVK